MCEQLFGRLMAAVYDDGIEADKTLSQIGYALRANEVAVNGLVQLNTFRRDRAKCDMVLEELGSGQIFQLSQDRGALARGCRLDREAITHAATAILKGLDNCDLLIINKFGRCEADGGGLRDIIAEAVLRGIITLIGVPRRNLHAWQRFAGETSLQCEIGQVALMRTWLCERLGLQALQTGDNSKISYSTDFVTG